ncbi:MULTISPECIES: hypothetical protein [Deinococcus]|uniref:Lipoprotein n=1 Tax=Deinococcus rufus TaxID=2136097 RepID=A0ABV7ZF31_9DEIO|nr:hypothetical protein [Deinococcus sp. AB2017081]WQE94104.1 hypothetical protein U2P90_11865 [Deinococcus sp. AB2017081]
MKNLSGHGDAPVSPALTFSQGRITIPSGGKVTLGTMNKIALGLIGSTALLASCGITPDGSGSVRFIDLQTEYTTGTSPRPQYVGCDNISGAAAGRATKTQVVVSFATGGTITSIRAQLKGKTTDTEGTVFDKTFAPSDPGVIKKSDGTYQIIFDADSATGGLLPTGIIVEPNPTVRTPQPVTATNKQGTGFYADLTITTTTGSKTSLASTILGSAGTIPVYSNCTVQTAQQLSR